MLLPLVLVRNLGKVREYVLQRDIGDCYVDGKKK